MSVPDIACGYFLGDTSCVRSWKHNGDHQPADVVLVDRRLVPLNRQYVVSLKGQGPIDHRRNPRDLDFATVVQYKGRSEVLLGPNFESSKRGTSSRRINRPAVKVDGRWLRRCPQLEVVNEAVGKKRSVEL